MGQEGNAVPASSFGIACITDEWLIRIRQNPAYQDFNIDKSIGKYIARCEANEEEVTPKGLVKWLNREKPSDTAKKLNSSEKPEPESAPANEEPEPEEPVMTDEELAAEMAAKAAAELAEKAGQEARVEKHRAAAKLKEEEKARQDTQLAEKRAQEKLQWETERAQREAAEGEKLLRERDELKLVIERAFLTKTPEERHKIKADSRQTFLSLVRDPKKKYRTTGYRFNGDVQPAGETDGLPE